MKRALVGSFALSLVAGLVSAQNATPPTTSPMPAPSANAAVSAMVKIGEIDLDKDGRVSSAEAQSNAQLRTSFATLDADSDGYLSRSEYAKWNKADKEESSGASPRSNSEMNSESRATPATPAQPATPGRPATPAEPATPAIPAQ